MSDNDNRREELVAQAILWSSEVGKDTCRDMLRAIGITSDELTRLGFDAAAYPYMHGAVSDE